MVYNPVFGNIIGAGDNSVKQHPGFTRRFRLAVLVGILVLGFSLRALNITWGIPEMHPYLGRHMEGLHPDEGIMISQIQGVLEGGLFEIGTLYYPPVQALLAVPVAWLTNWSGTPQLYLIARSISIAAGLASILALYFLAKKWNHRMALIASAFLSVSMAAARESHWANPESLSALWILLAIVVL